MSPTSKCSIKIRLISPAVYQKQKDVVCRALYIIAIDRHIRMCTHNITSFSSQLPSGFTQSDRLLSQDDKKTTICTNASSLFSMSSMTCCRSPVAFSNSSLSSFLSTAPFSAFMSISASNLALLTLLVDKSSVSSCRFYEPTTQESYDLCTYATCCQRCPFD